MKIEKLSQTYLRGCFCAHFHAISKRQHWITNVSSSRITLCIFQLTIFEGTTFVVTYGAKLKIEQCGFILQRVDWQV